ncbi:MAG: T9SS type A sorting domain-containing protein [Saprospiraceae bacterium]|nr:T9SS type A sorting domain-containing protein [Saprospiraceae bacterium]
MKKAILIITFITIGNLLFSQSIQGVLQGITYDNTPKSFTIFGHKTHFKSVDSNYVSFYNDVDTVDFWIPFSYKDYYINIYFTTTFQDTGIYHLKIYNCIDDTMYLDSAIQVISGIGNPFYFDDEIPKMVSAGAQEEIILETFYLTSFLSATNHSCYFINTKNDTIQADSISPLSQYRLKVYFTVPNNYHGLFSAVYRNSIDTLIVGKDNILVMNDSKSQIAEITPDSIHNLNWQSWKITVYGNNTHFTQDTNYIVSYNFIPIEEFTDSVVVLNDTTIKFNIDLPMGCKGATYPNTLICIYNEIDGIMFYTMRVDMYGSIPEINRSHNVKLYPNPAHEKITIDISNNNQEIVLMEIYNLEGKKIINTEHRTPNVEIDVSNWKPGIYFGRIIYENNENKEFKFIVN